MNSISESDLQQLVRATQNNTIDDSLLRANPVMELKDGMRALLVSLAELSLGELLDKQGVLARLTGASLEARYRFNATVQDTIAAHERLRASHKVCCNHLKAMRDARRSIHLGQDELDAVIKRASALLHAKQSNEDSFLRSRFERWHGNLMAIHASNITALNQFDVTIGVVTQILDRFLDIDSVVMPVWKHYALTIANSPGTLDATQRCVSGFREVNNQLIQQLDEEVK